MHFSHSEYWPWLVAAFIAAVFFCVYGAMMKKRQIAKFSSLEFFKRIAPDFNPRMQTVKTALFIAGFLLVCISAAGPQWGKKPSSDNLKGTEVFIAVDCSQSMAAEDYKPSRLDFAKSILVKITDRLAGNKIGVIAYAGEAFLECPLTTDMEAAKLFIDYADYSIMPVQGTDIAKAIDLASVSFSDNPNSEKALILLTDGENFDGDALASAKIAHAKNISICAIGVGSPEGTEFKINGVTKTDRSGNPVISKLDEGFLKKLAAETGGIYVRAGYDSKTVESVAAAVNSLKKTDLGIRSDDVYISRFQYSLAVAFIFIFLSFILGERRFLKK
ncbi:MAG: VWA domain-containing protein [bacterium]|nr:VWA domain-containing protein [bacterium]